MGKKFKKPLTRDSKGRFTSYTRYLSEELRRLGNDSSLFPKSTASIVTSGYIAPVTITTTPPQTTIGNWNNLLFRVNNTPFTQKRKFKSPSFDRVLVTLALVTLAIAAYLSGWQFNILVTRFEILKWIVFGHHPGLR
jgi:hypothetical protein